MPTGISVTENVVKRDTSVQQTLKTALKVMV